MKTTHAKKLLNGHEKLYSVAVNFLVSILGNKYVPHSILLEKNTKDFGIFILQENVLPEEEEQLARRIITLGCVGLHCPQQVIKRHFLLLQHAAYFDPVMLQVNVKSSSQRLLGYSIDKEPLSSKQHIDYSERLDDR